MNKYDHLYEALKKRYDEGLIPGFELGVCEKGKEVYKKNIFYENNSIYRMASMTKPITAVACMKAKELGLLDVYDNISKYIDGFKNMPIGKMENGKAVFVKYSNKEIRIVDILRHASGLGSGLVGDYQTNSRTAPKTLDEAIDGYKNWFLDFEPNSKSAYSGLTALDIVCYIIEKTSKMPYYDFLKKYILDPLEMVDTTYKLNSEQKIRLVKMYNKHEDNKMYLDDFGTEAGFQGFVEGYPCGAAGIFSTYKDYMNFAVMLSNKGTFNNNRVLSEESIKQMYTDTLDLPKEGVNEVFNWGYTFFVRGNRDIYSALDRNTFGWSGAYSTHFFVNPEKEIAVVMLTNLNNDLGSGSPNISTLEKAFHEAIETNW